MIIVLWICLFTVLVGAILYFFEVRHRRSVRELPDTEDSGQEAPDTDNSGSDNSGSVNSGAGSSQSDGEECCGLHLVCEKDSLSPMSVDIIYYDDDELDRFIGRDPKSYTPQETEEFAQVLMTLLPSDVAGWARSITQRRIELPPDVRDQLLLIIADQRSGRSSQTASS